MLHQSSLVVAVAVALLGLSTSHAQACRCSEPSTARAYAATALVVEGRVTNITPRPAIDGIEVKMTVARAWKADTAAEITFSTGTDCRYDLELDQRYILFLVKTPSGDLTTGRCMGNGKLAAKGQALAWLQRRAKKARVAPTRPSASGQ
jgi:hypothetical protein